MCLHKIHYFTQSAQKAFILDTGHWPQRASSLRAAFASQELAKAAGSWAAATGDSHLSIPDQVQFTSYFPERLLLKH